MAWLCNFAAIIDLGAFYTTNPPLTGKIFVQDWPAGGTGASQIAAICNPADADFYDCRAEDGPAIRTEHIFLHHMIQYVAAPEVFRARLVSETNPTYKAQLKASYEWLKTHWYGGPARRAAVRSGAMFTVSIGIQDQRSDML